MNITDTKFSKLRMTLILDESKRFFVPIGDGFDKKNIKPFPYYKEKYTDYNISYATESCLNYLSYSMRTKKECIDYLNKKGFLDEVIGEAIQRIEELGYIDDRRYAKEFVFSKATCESIGEFRLKMVLKKKGIAEEISKEALEFFTPEQKERIIRECAEKLIKRNEKLPKKAKETKVVNAIMQKGFSHSEVRTIVQDLLNNDSEGNETDEDEKQRNFFEKKIRAKVKSFKNKNIEKNDSYRRLASTFLKQGASCALIKEIINDEYENEL